jgi:hypothetical protein
MGKHRYRQWILGSLLFILYINDLPAAVSGNAKSVLYADDTSIIVTHPNHDDYVKNVDKIFLKSPPGLVKIFYL